MHIVKLMNDLFAIDAEAREKNMDHAARHGLRLEKAPALLDEIRAQILEAQKNALPQSATGKAANYTLALWSKLTRFLEYPELELSNNLAENSMRPIAIGRKNWIHIGSPAGRTQSRRDPIGRRELPSKEDSGARISGRSAAWSQQLLHPSRSRTHAQSLGRKTQSARLITPTHPSTVCLLSRLHWNFHKDQLIGIGAAVTRRPLPHHRAYGSVHGGSSPVALAPVD